MSDSVESSSILNSLRQLLEEKKLGIHQLSEI